MKKIYALSALLLGMSGASASAGDYPVNHLFLRLDVGTVAEIAGNKFLQNDFSDFYAGESGDMNNKWTAVYIQGDNTYLEIYDENGSSTKADVGLAFAANKKGDLQKNHSTLSQLCYQPYKCEVEKRVREPGAPTWFEQFKVLDSNEKLDTWIMEYGADYILAKPTPEGTSWARNDVSPKRYNSEWYQPNRLLKDVEHIYLTVTPEHYQRILKFAEVMGVVNGTLVVGSTVYVNQVPRITLKIGETTKVRSLVLSLNRDAGYRAISLGKSTLNLTGTFAQWDFE